MVELFFCLQKPITMRTFVFKEKYLSFADYTFSKLIPQLVIKNGLDGLSFAALKTFELTQAAGCPREGCSVLRCPCSLIKAGGVDFFACCLTCSFQQLSKIKISFKC